MQLIGAFAELTPEECQSLTFLLLTPIVHLQAKAINSC